MFSKEERWGYNADGKSTTDERGLKKLMQGNWLRPVPWFLFIKTPWPHCWTPLPTRQ